MSTAPIHDRLVEALGPVVAAHGLDLEDVDVTPAGRRRLLRVVVDKDGGVTLDELSEATRSVSRHLDDQDLMMHTLFDSPKEQAIADSGYADKPVELRRFK